MWNTGCNNIGNTLNVGLTILDNEDHHHAVGVFAGGSANFNSTIFPWCSNSAEVRGKAFVVTSQDDGTLRAYLFQDYHTNHVCWSAEVNDPWGARQPVTNGSASFDPQRALSAVDIIILPDRVCAFPAQSENDTWETIFDGVCKAITVVTGVLGKALPKRPPSGGQ